MAEKKKVYLSDHSESVLKSHSMRTAAGSAAYMLPSLRPRMKVLDIGCGPGSITVDLAALVPQGHVVGIDNGTEVIEEARALASERGLKNIEFQVGDAHALDFADQSFDIVHAHQVLQHLEDPTHALREWCRLVKSGGLLACREADFESVASFPEIEGVSDFGSVYVNAARARGGEPNGGRHLVAWARAAGIKRSNIKATASVWCFSSPEERASYSGMWIDRIFNSSYYTNMINDGHASKEDLDRFAQGVCLSVGHQFFVVLIPVTEDNSAASFTPTASAKFYEKLVSSLRIYAEHCS